MNNILNGQKILLLRSAEDGATTEEKIRQAGGIALNCPVIQIRLPDDTNLLDSAIQRLTDFDWLIFTSGHSIHFFAERYEALKLNIAPEVIQRIQIGSIGPATTEKLHDLGWPPHFTATTHTAEAFVEEFTRTHTIAGQKFLLPLSSIARRTLPDGLRQQGGQVEEVTAYINKPVNHLPDEILHQLNAGQIDWVFFTSSSTANNFITNLPESIRSERNFKSASIGPKTTETLRGYGIEPEAVAKAHTVEGLIEVVGTLE